MMNIENIRKNKLATILQFSIPSILAMLLTTLITITDGYFTGNYVGEEALAAINLGLPILYFYLGVGLCVGVGGSVICGRLLGAKERQKASEVFSQSMVTATMDDLCDYFVRCISAFYADSSDIKGRWRIDSLFHTILQSHAV